MILLFEEMTDRFGKMPDEAKYALESARIRWRARRMFISKLDSSDNGIRFTFTEKSPIDPADLLMRVQKEPHAYRLSPDGNLSVLHPSGCNQTDDKREQLKGCIAFLDSLLENAGQ